MSSIKQTVFNYIYRSGSPRSKKDIAEDLDLSMPTIYKNVDDLLKSGVIEYCGQQQADSGRPAMLLRVVPDAKTAIGVHITSYCIRIVSTDLSGSEKDSRTVPLKFTNDCENYCHSLAAEINAFIEDTGMDTDRILGVGIAVPGIAEPDILKFHHCATLEGEEFSLLPFAEEISYPVYLENDASSGGFAEWYGSESDRNIAFLSLLDGVGGAVLVNGMPFAGSNHRSGEFGHMTVEPSGRLCSCGQRGCLEAYCSPVRLTTDLGLTAEEFFSRLDAGDEKCRSVWEDYKAHLATALHNIRMSFDCEVVLGGYLTDLLLPREEEIKEAVSVLDPFDPDCSYLSVSRHSKYSSMLGVALHFIDEYLSTIQ